MATTHTRIYKDTLKDLRILATLQDKKMMDLMQEIIDYYKANTMVNGLELFEKQSKEEVHGT